MANDSEALSQDDIDALLAMAQADAVPPAAPAAPAVAPKPAPAPAPDSASVSSGALDQDDIDALLAEATAPSPPAVAAPKPAAKPAPSGGLDQDDIDALIAATIGETAAPEQKKPETEAHQPQKASTASEPSLTKRRTSGASTVAPPPSSAPAAMSQEDIDQLVAQTLDETGGPAPAAPVPVTAAAAKITSSKSAGPSNPGTDIERLLQSVETSAQEKAKVTMDAMPGLNQGAPLDQDDIDKLLAELGAKTTTSKKTGAVGKTSTAPVTAPVGATSKTIPGTGSQQPTLALSSEDLDALVGKHAVGGDTEAGVEMIDQNDIDALVKQLATATGDPNNEKISDALAKHGDEIDKLMEKASEHHPTMDAVEPPRDPTARNSAASTMAGQFVHTGPVIAQFPAGAMRSTRWLLAAAVLLLAMCAATLAMVVGAVRNLSSELKQERVAQLVPTENYHDDFSAAQAKLAEPDEQEAAKGVMLLERLQKRYPEHEHDIALVLARYHRSAGAIARAARDFSQFVDGSSGPLDDPRIYLEYADCLFQQQDEALATRQVYTLLANESYYRADRDQRGLARSTEQTARNRQAVQDAYLALGRMLTANARAGGLRVANAHTGHEAGPGNESDEHSSHGAATHASASHGESAPEPAANTHESSAPTHEPSPTHDTAPAKATPESAKPESPAPTHHGEHGQ